MPAGRSVPGRPRLGSHGSTTTVQLYVPGCRLVSTLGVPSGRFAEPLSPVHCTVAAVTPGPASDWKLTVILESGTSVKLLVTAFAVLAQDALALMAAVWSTAVA